MALHWNSQSVVCAHSDSLLLVPACCLMQTADRCTPERLDKSVDEDLFLSPGGTARVGRNLAVFSLKLRIMLEPGSC